MQKQFVLQWLIIALCLAIGKATPAFAVAQKMEVTPANVEAAIDRCVSYLAREQKKDGQRTGAWAGAESFGTGQTCLVTLALISAGKTPNFPAVNLGLRHIRAHKKPSKTYEAALQVMVLCAAEPTKDMAQIKENVEWLVKVQSNSGGWGYGDSGGGDESNTQFAVLALWEASKLGIEIPNPKRDDNKTAFEACQAYWQGCRMGNAWGYMGRGPTGSMTCAGIASSIILQDVANGRDAKATIDRIQCCGSQIEGANPKENIELAFQWLANNFAANRNPGENNYTLYYLYALERVGRLTGQRLIGQEDWYRKGAEFLLQSQLTGGSFRDGLDEVTSSALALLFLSKGKRQVVIGQLQYGNDNDWQRHRRSIQHLTGQIETVWKRELSWQTVRLDKADLSALLETPILFISGTREFKLTDSQRNLLKEYTNNGGFIFAEACNGDGCKGDEFDRSFRMEMEKIFDKPLQKLPPSHPIWAAETKVDPNALPKDFWLYGLDSCCRTSVVYSPISMSCRWELARPYGPKKAFGPAVDGDILNAVKIGINVAAYATGRELKDKLDAVQVVQKQRERMPLERGSLAIGKINHSGGADDTPKAVSNLLDFFRVRTQSLVESKTPLVSLDKEELEKYPFLYIHGRNKFTFSAEESSGLRKHFETGGFVMGDSICASAEFTECVRKEFSKALPDSRWRIVDPNEPFMQKNNQGNNDLTSVTLVDPTSQKTDLKQAKREGPAEILALEWKGRTVMLFSPNDMSCALESKHSMQCRGYIRQDAFQIGFNMLRYALSLTD